jgi:threonine synthase
MNSENTSATLRCIEGECRASFPIDQRLYLCSACGGLLDVDYDLRSPASPAELKAVFKQRRMSGAACDLSGVWRFRELLPFVADVSSIVSLVEGNTPIYNAPRSASYAKLESLRFKHQGMNPTGSFKDNGMTTAVTHARMLGAGAVACASTGNTSASMAAYAARAGMRGFVFVPAGQVAHAKLSQSIEYGASVVEIEGNFDDAMRIVRELALEADVYLLNSLNPFRLEGQKTIIIEMMEQLEWEAPDWIVLPGGNLGNTSAFGKALNELHALGFIARMPRLAVIQAEGAAPFYDLFMSESSTLTPVAEPSTLATAIRIGSPVSWKKAVRALRWTGGIVASVGEQEIADAKAIIGVDGIGCEPASAATLAGIKRLTASGTIGASDSVVAVLTGNLMKDAGYTVDYHSGRLTLGQRKIESTYANRSIRVPANQSEIRRILAL